MSQQEFVPGPQTQNGRSQTPPYHRRFLRPGKVHPESRPKQEHPFLPAESVPTAHYQAQEGNLYQERQTHSAPVKHEWNKQGQQFPFNRDASLPGEGPPRQAPVKSQRLRLRWPDGKTVALWIGRCIVLIALGVILYLIFGLHMPPIEAILLVLLGGPFGAFIALCMIIVLAILFALILSMVGLLLPSTWREPIWNLAGEIWGALGKMSEK